MDGYTHVTTESGFECEVEDAKITDMRFIDLLDEMEEGNTLAMSRLVTYLLGKEQKAALYEHIAARSGGKVDVTECSRMIAEIFQGFGERKKK